MSEKKTLPEVSNKLENQEFAVADTSDMLFTREEVIYGRGGKRELKATLYCPQKKSAPRPAVVYIHGGGWSSGSSEHFARQATAMAGKGFVGLCLEYRLSGEAVFPAALHDVKCAVRYLRSVADKYNIDSAKIAAVGGSAGGHLAAMLATTSEINEFEGSGGHETEESFVQAAVIFNGEFDLPSWWKYGRNNELMQNFMGCDYEEKNELYRFASPLTHVNKHTPPCLLLHGDCDQVVPVIQAVDFYEKIIALGGKAELIRISDVGHAWFNHEPHLSESLQYMAAFLARQLQAET